MALASLSAACGEDDPRTTPATSPVTTSTAPPTTTTADALPTTTVASAAEPEPGAADEPSTSATTAPDRSEGTTPSDDISNGELRWSDVLDDLSASAESCIRESLGEEYLEALLARPVTSGDFSTDDDALVLACIGPEPARDVFLSALVSVIGSEVGDEEMACLREQTAGLDVIGIAESPNDSPKRLAAVFMSGRCLGDAFFSFYLAPSGVEFVDLSDGETACLREWQAGVDWDGLSEAAEGPEEDFVAESWAFLMGLQECLPEQIRFDTGSVDAPAGVDDDHGNSQAAATAIEVGEAVGGSLDYQDGDVDYFVFEAVGGEAYEIGVAPGELEDPTVRLYGADGLLLDYDDDSGGSFAPRLFWPADGSGPLYVKVGGYDNGSYTLMITVPDVKDDHADWRAAATAAAVGEAVEGVLHHGDFDYFVFQAVEGELYELGVSSGTLANPAVVLYDADGAFLASDSPRLHWRAASTGPLYVEVHGFGNTGSYTLMIAR